MNVCDADNVLAIAERGLLSESFDCCAIARQVQILCENQWKWVWLATVSSTIEFKAKPFFKSQTLVVSQLCCSAFLPVLGNTFVCLVIAATSMAQKLLQTLPDYNRKT